MISYVDVYLDGFLYRGWLVAGSVETGSRVCLDVPFLLVYANNIYSRLDFPEDSGPSRALTTQTLLGWTQSMRDWLVYAVYTCTPIPRCQVKLQAMATIKRQSSWPCKRGHSLRCWALGGSITGGFPFFRNQRLETNPESTICILVFKRIYA